MWTFMSEYKFLFAALCAAVVACAYVKGFQRMFLLQLIICSCFYLLTRYIRPEKSNAYTWHFIWEFSAVFFASYIGLAAYRFMNLFQRLMFLQVCIYLLFYVLTWYVKFNQIVHKEPINTIVLYDFYNPVEAGILLFAGLFCLNRKPAFVAGLLAFLGFLFVHVTEICNRDAQLFDGFSIVLQNILVTICYLPLLYMYFSRSTLAWKREPDVWLLIGLITYSACIVPYVSVMDEIQHADPQKKFFPDKNTNAVLYYFIVGALANIRYGFMVITFWLLYKYSSQKKGAIA